MPNNQLNEMYYIGICGTGFVGGNIAKNFIERGYNITAYSLDPQYINNKEKIKDCDIVFFCLPTPTTPKGFDDSILVNAIKETTKDGQIIVIKSTIIIGTTDKIQKMFPDRYILFSPEFLTEALAYYDVSYPARNIIGYTEKSKKFAYDILKLFPGALYDAVVPCKDAELIKYVGNCFYYFKVCAMNLFYDLAKIHGINFENIIEMNKANPMIAPYHLDIYHKNGRGAGNHCLPKDFEAFIEMYNGLDEKGKNLLISAREYNNQLLKNSNKDLDILEGIYGKQYLNNEKYE